MIPSEFIEFDQKSREEFIYNKFSELSDEYYVFHSLNTLEVKNIKKKFSRDGEIDFLVLHQQKGIIVIEAKAGEFKIINNQWHYQNGLPMKHGGPYNQAKSNKYKLQNIIEREDKKNGLKDKLNILHAVCFPSVNSGVLKNIKLPIDAHPSITLCNDDLDNLAFSLDRIYEQSFELKALSDIEFRALLDILLPSYNIFQIKNVEVKILENKFIRLLNEQFAILDYLEFQNFATINGIAGTGKTLIALEKARRLSLDKKVLFLCYNKHLRDFLETNYKYDSVDYFTIDQFAYQYRKKIENRYIGLRDYLERCYLNEITFDYQHVIIDEGQDFGSEELENAEVLKYFYYIIVEKLDGNMYIFYDKLQLVQGDIIPKIIQESDCKLTLYKNCRNTFNIAKTALKPIEVIPKIFKGNYEGVVPSLYMSNDNSNHLDQVKNIVREYAKKGHQNITVLTLKGADKSFMLEIKEFEKIPLEDSYFLWTTSRKFKGLEADVIILVDIDKRTFFDNKLLFYVGASRAKYELALYVMMSKDECNEVLEQLDIYNSKIHPKFKLAAYLNATVK